MDKIDIVNKILAQGKTAVNKESAVAYAPANIALCKYWGKRDTALNLPFNSSLSISLADKGAETKINLIDAGEDQVILNGKIVTPENIFAKKITNFLDLFRVKKKFNLQITTNVNIPIAAGLASSACGFAALVKALDKFFDWQLDEKSLSILARLGSGSACRSLWNGFVEWQVGTNEDGMDSYAYPLTDKWQELQIGVLILSSESKKISSRDAMQQTVKTSPFYAGWLDKVTEDFKQIKAAISKRDFNRFGKIAESNALAMHATMQTAWPPIYFSLPETIAAMQQVWEKRQAGLELFFTQDAGPNLKLLFLKKDKEEVRKAFPNIEIVTPF